MYFWYIVGLLVGFTRAGLARRAVHTLQQLQNLINCRNIGQAKDITAHVNKVKDFLEFVTKCHMLTAAMHLLSMAFLDDTHIAMGLHQD